MSATKQRVHPAYPVVGRLTPWPLAELIPAFSGTGFQCFETPTMQGLVNVEGGRLDILSLDAKQPGCGDCGRFLAECMKSYTHIRVLFIQSPLMDGILIRRGFTPFSVLEDGEQIEGRHWKSTPLRKSRGRNG